MMGKELEFLRSLEFADSCDQDCMDSIVAEVDGLLGMLRVLRDAIGLKPGVSFDDGVKALWEAVGDDQDARSEALRLSLERRAAYNSSMASTILDGDFI